MELLDLHDYALLEIFERLDQKSVLQMMAVCERFERLIGHTRSLYKDFELVIMETDSIEELRAMENIRRLIGTVTVCKVQFVVNQEQFDAADKILQKIGSKLDQINFEVEVEDDSETTILTMNKSQFLKLLDRASNVETLELYGVRLVPDVGEDKREIKELKNLKQLSIDYVENPEVFPSIVPSSLKGFSMEVDFEFTADSTILSSYSEVATKILTKAKNLDSLCLLKLSFHRFEYSASNCNIKDLTIMQLEFPEKIDFEKFSKFLKIQKSVVDLCLDFGIEEMSRNDYSEALLHLVNLKTVERLVLGYNEKYVELIKKGKIYNESVKRLEMRFIDGPFDYQPYARCFPNVTSLELEFFEDVSDIDISSIKSLKNLTKLEVIDLGDKIFEKIEFEQVRELEFKGIVFNQDLIERVFEKLVVFNMDDFDMETNELTMVWKNFAEKNQQLENFEINNLTILHLHILLEKLPKLRSLKIEQVNLWSSTYKPTVDLIGKCYDRLETFEIEFYGFVELWARELFEECLKESYPNIQYSRKNDNYIFSK
jgi:hypothetical protein